MARFDPVTTVVGNLTADPKLKVSKGNGSNGKGSLVADFRVAYTPRYLDNQTGEWTDRNTIYFGCAAWGELAENICDTLRKGDRVILTGRISVRTYDHVNRDTNQPEKRTVMDLTVDEIGPSLRWATAKVAKIIRDNSRTPPPIDEEEPPPPTDEEITPAS